MEVERDIADIFDADVLHMLEASHGMFHGIPVTWTGIGAEPAE